MTHAQLCTLQVPEYRWQCTLGSAAIISSKNKADKVTVLLWIARGMRVCEASKHASSHLHEEVHTADLVPHWQIEGFHDPEDSVSLTLGQQTSLIRQLCAECHVNVDGFTMQ